MTLCRSTREENEHQWATGTVSNKTQVSTSMVASGSQNLENILVDINVNYQASLELQSCLTCVVENLHAVTKMKHPTPTMLDHARGVGNSMIESLKRIALWSVKYFTNSHSYYPGPELGMKLGSLSSMASLSLVTMGPSDIAFMRQWARDHGQPVHQMTVRQLSTMQKPGTIPMTAYGQSVPVNPPARRDPRAGTGR